MFLIICFIVSGKPQISESAGLIEAQSKPQMNQQN
jgi:hypothetical protein